MRDRGARIAAAGALALLAAACSTEPRMGDMPEPVRASRAERERQINAEWQNHTLRELVERWGPPHQMLNIPGGGNPPGFVLVYLRDEGSGCIDAFAVAYGDVTRVRLYQCR